MERVVIGIISTYPVLMAGFQCGLSGAAAWDGRAGFSVLCPGQLSIRFHYLHHCSNCSELEKCCRLSFPMPSLSSSILWLFLWLLPFFFPFDPFYSSPFFISLQLIHFSTRTVDPASPLPRVHGTPYYAIGYETVLLLNSIVLSCWIFPSFNRLFFFFLFFFVITTSLPILRVFPLDIRLLLTPFITKPKTSSEGSSTMAEMDSASSTGVNLASDMRRRNVPHTEGLRRKPDGTEESKRKPKLKVCFLLVIAP